MIVKQSVPGRLIVDGDNAALVLGAPNEDATVYLAYALITQGPENRILPSFVLDDWGNAIRDLQLYEWIQTNALQYPRAEVFGLSPAGDEVQYFLRDLELFAGYPVYAFAEKSDEAGGVLLKAVLIEDESAESPQRTTPPDEVNELLREAQVSWWRAGPRQDQLGFIEQPPIEGD